MSPALKTTLKTGERTMAWLEQRGWTFHLWLRVGARKLKRPLKTTHQQEAEQLVSLVDRRLALLKQG